MKTTLFDIVGEFEDLYRFAADDEDVQSEEAFISMVESLTGELEQKSGGYVAVINRLEAEQARAEEIAKAYSAVAKSRKNHVKHMKDALLVAMDRLDRTEMPAGDLTIKIKKNGGMQPLVIDSDVPENMTKITIEPDNEKIRDFLKENTCAWAHLEERGRHIEIK